MLRQGCTTHCVGNHVLHTALVTMYMVRRDEVEIPIINKSGNHVSDDEVFITS